MSITSKLINEKIEDFEYDLKQVLKEKERVMNSASEHKFNCIEVSSLAIKATADAYNRVEKTIRSEISVLKNCFSDDMINDLDYIIDIHDGLSYGDVRMIIGTRADIVKFEESGISENDYSRDMQAIGKKIDDISKFNSGIRLHTMDIPNHKNEAIRSLVLALTRGLNGYIENLPDEPIKSDVIKDIITTISDVKRLPKNQDSFDEWIIETIDGLREKN